MIALALAAALFQPQSDSPSSVQMGNLEARLFYKETGRFSENILDRKPEFVGHNTIIGEGDAEEYADDILVTLRIVADKFSKKPHKFIDSPVEITVRDRAGKLVGSRKWDSLLTSDKGVEVKSLWLNDATCKGELTFTGRYNGKAKTAKITLGCGE